jgi:hypothetical protein
VALASGIALGSFFGEKVAFPSIGSRAFIQLLPITGAPAPGACSTRTWRRREPRWSVARDVLGWWKER